MVDGQATGLHSDGLIGLKPDPNRPPTPPHHPIHNVHYSPARISKIVAQTLPDEILEKSQQLPSGQSFNNRIYFLKLGPRSNDTSHDFTSELVLKVSGKFFGPAKVQNEVSCLLLFEKHCPDIPIPRVIAWSEDGVKLVKASRDPNIQITELPPLPQDEDKPQGWILMTRLQGRTLQPHDIEAHGDTIMQQMAQHVAAWRKIPTPSQNIGNLELTLTPDPSLSGSTQLRRHLMKVQGLLIAGKPPSHPLPTAQSYFKYKLLDQLHILETESIFSPNRPFVPSAIRHLVNDILPSLASFSQESIESPLPYTFTHYDLSPRNILISPVPQQSGVNITGIIDLEFAGFFPPTEEFTNSRITHADYWSDSAWELFTSHLSRLGGEVPTTREWDEAACLIGIVESIAPWYLREGGVKGEELKRELEEAGRRVMKEVSKLESLTA